MEDGKNFSIYIRNLRDEQDIGIQALCQGLCTGQEISYLETGQRQLRRNLQEAILERLGVGAEDYENFVDYVEYGRLAERQGILHCITHEKFDKAECLLSHYCERYCCGMGSGNDAGDKLEEQFYLSMTAQIMRCRGAGREALYAVFRKALELTVPEFDKKPLAEQVFSIKELNLLLEAEQYRKEGERPERYGEAVAYIERKKLDRVGRAKIYSKAVYFLCRCCLTQREMGKEDLLRLFRYCNRAFEILRRSERMYFLWEILSVRKSLLKKLLNGEGGALANAATLERLDRENEEWLRVLEEMHSEFGIRKETFEYCWLYVPKGIYCINDVIRIRRKMLGISAKELCDGICDIKSLRRLESCETRPQRAVAEALFERLGMSREFTKTELVTENPKARERMDKARRLANDSGWDGAERILAEVAQMIPSEIRSNRQTLARHKLIFQWKKGEIGSREYCEQMKEVLELTLPYEVFLREGEKYLTNEEAACIANRMPALEKRAEHEEEFLTCLQRFEEYYQTFVDKGLYGTIAGMYEFIMSVVSSYWGNRGEYDRADKYSTTIMRECLRLRRGGSLNKGLYDRWWNNMERKKKGIPIAKTFDSFGELTKCILFSILFKHFNSTKFYQTKLTLQKQENRE